MKKTLVISMFSLFIVITPLSNFTAYATAIPGTVVSSTPAKSNKQTATSTSSDPIIFDQTHRSKRVLEKDGVNVEVKEYSVQRDTTGVSHTYFTLTNTSDRNVTLSLTPVSLGMKYITQSTTQGSSIIESTTISCLNEYGEPNKLTECTNKLKEKLPTGAITTQLFSPVTLSAPNNILEPIVAKPGETVRFMVYQVFWDDSFENTEWAKNQDPQKLQTLIDHTTGTPVNGFLSLNGTISNTDNKQTLSSFALQFEVMKFTEERKAISMNDIYDHHFPATSKP